MSPDQILWSNSIIIWSALNDHFVFDQNTTVAVRWAGRQSSGLRRCEPTRTFRRASPCSATWAPWTVRAYRDCSSTFTPASTMRSFTTVTSLTIWTTRKDTGAMSTCGKWNRLPPTCLTRHRWAIMRLTSEYCGALFGKQKVYTLNLICLFAATFRTTTTVSRWSIRVVSTVWAARTTTFTHSTLARHTSFRFRPSTTFTLNTVGSRWPISITGWRKTWKRRIATGTSSPGLSPSDIVSLWTLWKLKFRVSSLSSLD